MSRYFGVVSGVAAGTGYMLTRQLVRLRHSGQGYIPEGAHIDPATGHEYILHASALLALSSEPVSERVTSLADLSFTTGVTVAEVVSKLRQKGIPEAEALLASLEIEVRSEFWDQAAACGKLHAETRGMKGSPSLADCICLAMAQWSDVTAVTTEKEWPKLSAAATS